MTDAGARRERFFADREKVASGHNARAFDYEKLAIDFANTGFKALTYLNGGALVAIPAVMTLFQTNIINNKFPLLLTAASFIVGLVSIVGAQACGFFTMARRAEAQQFFSHEQLLLICLTHYPEQYESEKTKAEANTFRASAESKIEASNTARFWGIVLVWVSVTAFILGCLIGAYAVLQ
jgi:hypothetical protein